MSLLDRLKELDDANAIVKNKEKELTKLKDAQKNLSEEIIPEIMESMGQVKFGSTEYEAVIYSRFRPNLPKDSSQRQKAFEWLAENGFEGIFNNQVVVRFNPEEYEEMVEFANKTPNAYIERTVHHQTLEALINEQVEKDPDFPIELFNAYEHKRTKVTKL